MVWRGTWADRIGVLGRPSAALWVRGDCVSPVWYDGEMNHQSPATRPTSRICPWCSTTFTVVYRPGRPRIYCRLSCRQRSYERRRGLGVLPPPDRVIMTDTGPLARLPNRFPGYERGYGWGLDSRAHAMRPAGITEKGERRLALCGTLARPVPRGFHHTAVESCRTCTAVERVRPSARGVYPSADLAALRWLLDNAAIEASQPPTHATKSSTQILQELLTAI